MSDRRQPFDADAAADPDAGIYGLPHSAEEARVVLIPVPWDATTSYRAGAAKGPRAIQRASLQVDLFDLDTGRPWQAGIALCEESPEVIARNAQARSAAEQVIAKRGLVQGDPALERALGLVNEQGAWLNEWLRCAVGEHLERGKLVGVVGGDHSSVFGAIAAVAEHAGDLGVLHVDAHADLREAYEGFAWSHASIMFNVATRLPRVRRIVQVGVRDFGEAERAFIEGSRGRVVTHFDGALRARQFDGETWSAQCERIVADLPERVYVSFDIDGLDPSLCPHTGTPVPGGLGFAEASHLLGRVVASGRRIVGFDLNEVAPGPDADDEWDANVGARLLYRMIGWALRSQGA